MTKNERWISSVSMMISVLPLILVALMQSIIEPPYYFTDIATEEVHVLSAGALNFAACFCLIPFLIVLIARFFRQRGVIVSNLNVVSVATLVLSVVYVLAMMYIVYNNLRNMSVEFVVKKINYISLVCSALCGIFSLLANFLPDLKPNPFFGVKNDKTMAHPNIWKKVNVAAASALTYIFLIASVLAAYSHKIFGIVVLIGAIFLYYVWVYLYASYVHKKIVKGQKTNEAKPSVEENVD